uniref:hypothetical protein n=1 Tax=Vibrio harveyi TaxID=669 RepID=UPI001E2A86C5
LLITMAARIGPALKVTVTPATEAAKLTNMAAAADESPTLIISLAIVPNSFERVCLSPKK